MLEVRRGPVVERPVEPVVVGPDGEEVVMTELRSGDRVDGWVAAGGFALGPHEIVSAGGVDLTTTFWISGFGMEEIDASSLVGRAWQLVDGLALPAPVTDLVWAALEDGPQVQGAAGFLAFDQASEVQMCELAEAAGAPCQPCPTGGSERCIYAGGIGMDLWETYEVPAADLPVCGVDRLDTSAPEIGPFACALDDLDLSCGCEVLGPRAALPLLGVASVLALRRRRR